MKNTALASTLVALVALGVAQAQEAGLAKLKEIALEGESYVDYVTVDPAGERLYVGHAPAIDVIDLAKLEKIGTVKGVEGAHGAVSVPEVKKGFATAGRKNKLVVFDLETFAVTKEIDTGAGCDALLFVAATKEVWTFNGKGKSVTCVDAATLAVTATIALEGKPEAAVESEGVVYVNLEDKSAVCALDAKKHAVLGVHPLAPGEEPTGLALDAKDNELLVGCGNRKLLVVSLADWSVVATAEIGEHCDGVAFDPETRNVFASCRGASAGFHLKDAKTLEALPSKLDPAKTCAVDPKSHRLFLTVGPARGEKGTVKVLVYGPPAQ